MAVITELNINLLELADSQHSNEALITREGMPEDRR